MGIFKHRRKRIEAAERKAEENVAELQRIQSNWPEVRELSAWARETRERNHLTELFVRTIGSRSS